MGSSSSLRVSFDFSTLLYSGYLRELREILGYVCAVSFDFSTLLYSGYLRELREILGYVCAVSALALLSASLLLVENQRLEICLLCLSRSCHIAVSISCHCPLADTVLFPYRRL